MRSFRAPVCRRLTAVCALALAAPVVATLGAPASAGRPATAAHTTAVTLHRGGPDATISFSRGRAGEAFLDTSVSAKGVSWAEVGNESAVVSAYVDGRYATDIVITSRTAVDRQFALGHLAAGRHTLRFHYATKRSLSDAGVARLTGIAVHTVAPSSPAYDAARFAPVLYGRDIGTPGGSGPFQNNHTDTPLVAWHEVSPVAGKPGHHVLEYSVVWSNEDGGTGTSALMGQWGRTTDIEWIYRVEVNARGGRVPGSAVFQGAGHATSPFQGTYDGTHPRLQTCTSNNNVCDIVTDPMRFALSTRDGRPARQPREHLMDIHPWTYQVTAREMVREGKVISPTDPSSGALGDPRTYLYLAVNHTADPAGAAGTVGLAVDVRLTGDPTTYTSDHGQPTFTVNRNGPAATTVKLPAGTTAADVESIAVRRVAFPVLPPNQPDTTTTLTVTDLTRAFLLGRTYLPQASFASFRGSVVLTNAAPSQVIWTAP
jgi:hypothetical protein